MIPGKHIGKVVRHDYGHSSQKGTPQLYVTFQVDSETGSETIGGYVYFTEKAMGIARKSLKAMGFDPDADTLQTLIDNPLKLMGHECSLTIIEEEGQDGEYRLKVAFIDPVSTPPKDGEVKGIDGALRAVKGSKKPSKGKVDKATGEIVKHFAGGAAKAGETKGDDIPF